MNEQSSGMRTHIGFFGMRNVGKSSLVNAFTGQSVSIVSDILGTTTDPVKKSMELLPLGPVMIYDTPGIDDVGELGKMRVKRAEKLLGFIDIAILVTTADRELNELENILIEKFKSRDIKYIIVYNKSDLYKSDNAVSVSARTGENINFLKETVAKLIKSDNDKRIIADYIDIGDVVILVTPIDESAPKGRLILPQQQTVRDILDAGGIPILTKETELPKTLESLSVKPKLVITDSQVFPFVSKTLPNDIPLTSFSILFARFKGNLQLLINGAKVLDNLTKNSKILISEACTHHRQCNDIGTVKLPALIEKYVGARPQLFFTSGNDFPDNLDDYDLIIHCGGCMLTEKQMKNRIAFATDADVPITNYGIAIAYMNGILKRTTELFNEISL